MKVLRYLWVLSKCLCRCPKIAKWEIDIKKYQNNLEEFKKHLIIHPIWLVPRKPTEGTATKSTLEESKNRGLIQ